MIRILSLALCLLFVVAGCSDAPTEPTSNDPDFSPWWIARGPTNGRLFISATSGATGNTVYESGGHVHATTSASSPAVDGGFMTVGGITIPYNPNTGYRSTAVPTFGGVTQWGLSGNAVNGIPLFGDTMYVPEVIRVLYQPPGIERAGLLPIIWNGDKRNTGEVLVRLWYAGREGAPETVSSEWVTADDGSFVVHPSFLSAATVGDTVFVSVSRGAWKTIEAEGKRLHVYAYTTAAAPLQVVE